MKILGLITARGGSKGIPGKNIKVLGDKPLIAWVIQDGLDASLLNQVVVSTDCNEIANVSLKYGAEVPFMRPSELAVDTTPSIDVVLHALDFFEKKGVYFDAVCLLQPTSPFKPKGFINKCVQLFLSSKADCLVSVLKVPHEYNPHWTFEMNSNGYLKIATGETDLIARRQELPEAYHRDGSIYLTRVSIIKEKNVLIGGNAIGILSSKIHYANLDTVEDWERAKMTYEILFNQCAE